MRRVAELDKSGDATRGDRVDRICRRAFPATYIFIIVTLFLVSTRT